MLGYSENEIGRMTLRKFDNLFEIYCKLNGFKTENYTNIDDIIPEGV